MIAKSVGDKPTWERGSMINLVLTLLNIIITIVSFLVLGFLYLQHRRRIHGIDFWMGTHLSFTLAFVFSATRVIIPEPISIILANPFFGIGFILLMLGMSRFFDKPVKLKPFIVLFFIYLAFLIYYTLFEDNLSLRQAALYAYLIIINLYIAYFVLRNKTQETGSAATFGAVTLYMIGLFFAISFGLCLADSSNHSFFDDSPRDVMILAMTIFTTILMTYSEIMLISARLLDNVKVSERKFSLVFDNTQLPVMITRLSDGKIHEYNQSFSRLFGYEEHELVGKTTLDISLWEDSDQRDYMINQVRKDVDVKDMEAILLTKDGRKLTCHVSSNLVNIQGEDYILNDIYDMTDSVKLREDLKRLATVDHLTGLANRTLFYDRFDQAKSHADRHDHQLTIIIMDLDKMKEINDKYGHMGGDKALVHLTRQIGSVLRKTDTFARFGGDEFCIILNEMKNIEGTKFVLRKIEEAMNVPLKLDDGQELTVKVSMGVSLYPKDGTTINELLKMADKAMYSIKNNKDIAYRFYTELDKQ